MAKAVRRNMMDWTKEISQIGDTFMALVEQYPADLDRPYTEFSRNQSDLYALLPVR